MRINKIIAKRQRSVVLKAEKSVPHYQGWSRVPEGYYTKTKLRNELGLKPFNEAVHDATLRAYVNGSWKEFILYHVDNCIEIKKRKVVEHPITELSIAESLYLINKSAKVSRDTKQENYHAKKHSVVQAAKTRQNKYYDLKETVLQKLQTENRVTVKGYHTMSGGEFLLLELQGFTFHMPVLDIPEGIENLGELVQQISSEKSISVSVNFFEAENLLNRYICQD